MRSAAARFPCSLHREDALTGEALARVLDLPYDDSSPLTVSSDSLTMQSAHRSCSSTQTQIAAQASSHVSILEHIFTNYAPVLEHVLLHLPTSSVIRLTQLNRRLRDLLRNYPVAWKSLSFRQTVSATLFASAAVHGDGTDLSDMAERPGSFNFLMRSVLPRSSNLRMLDLDNSPVDGVELVSQILTTHHQTLEHLSVRGCKRVSLRYHVLPWLELQSSLPTTLTSGAQLALKSLYVYRCRHHRRRPYLPSSLTRRDSDSRPTHQLIELCHRLNIWTDTAWCPTPASRCFRRRDYHTGHHSHSSDPAANEVWVPFDRLWRSQNFVGPTDRAHSASKHLDPVSHTRVWEEQDHGSKGEALGAGLSTIGEGKYVPMHLRQSHSIFVTGYRCDKCNEQITERCEQCSVRCHCMGCRKTLCASCAFDRPLRAKRRRLSGPQAADRFVREASATGLLAESSGSGILPTRQDCPSLDIKNRNDRFWWAPGAEVSPNRMADPVDDLASDEEEPPPTRPLHLDMFWCCLRPSFSGGGGIAFLGTNCGENVKAAPLPKGEGFEDPSFCAQRQTKRSSSGSSEDSDMVNTTLRIWMNSRLRRDATEQLLGINVNDYDISRVLEQDIDPLSDPWQRSITPRSLCPSCYRTEEWRVICSGCNGPLCIDHDVKSLRVRRCGYRRLADERTTVQDTKWYVDRGQAVPERLRDRAMAAFYGKWKPLVDRMAQDDERRRAIGRWAPETYRFPAEEPSWETTETSECDAFGDDDQNTNAPGDSETSASSTDDLANNELSRDPFFNMVDLARLAPLASTLQGGQSITASNMSQQNLTSTSTDQSKASQMQSTAPNIRRTRSMPQMPRPQALQNFNDRRDPGLIAGATTRWIGCGRYFCPSPRMHGDSRQRCSAESALQMCQLCEMHVCSACFALNMPANKAGLNEMCSCTSCKTFGFVCPNCVRDERIVSACRYEAEEAERRKKAEEDARLEAEKREVVRLEWIKNEAERQAFEKGLDDIGEFWSSIIG